MTVVPKKRLDTGYVTARPGGSSGVLIECEVSSPPSAEGRTVYVYLDAEAVTQLVPVLRSSAIAARMETMAP